MRVGISLTTCSKMITNNITLTHKANPMLSSALTVVDNHAGVTLGGALGSKVYDQITGPSGQSIVRRIAATANTTQQTITIGHQLLKTGFLQRCRTLVKHEYKVLNSDLSLTGDVVPYSYCQFTMDRPVNSGGIITDAILVNNAMALIDVLVTSGQFAKLINQEA